MLRLTGLAVALLACSPALAHTGHGQQGPPGVPWTLDPALAFSLAGVLLLYLVGFARLRRRSGMGRSRLDRGFHSFLGGWATLAFALLSPLHEAGETSFTMHMIEHELIMLPAALLLVAAHPGAAMLWSLPRSMRVALRPAIRAAIWSRMTAPVTATMLQAGALVMWHMPALFSRALERPGWHIAQHASFLLTALLFWWAMLAAERTRGGPLLAALCLFATSCAGGGLGALMALDSSPWYAPYVALGMTPFGLTAEQDQQLAGVIMWVPGGLFHLGAALVFVARALRGADRPTGRIQPQKVSTTA